MWGSHILAPTLKDSAIRSESGSSWVPTVGVGSAAIQHPHLGAAAVNRRALERWSARDRRVSLANDAIDVPISAEVCRSQS